MQLYSPYINSSKKYMKKRETERNNQKTNISKKQHSNYTRNTYASCDDDHKNVIIYTLL